VTWAEEWAQKAARLNRSPIYLVRTLPAPGVGAPSRFISSAPWPFHTEALLLEECSISWGSLQLPSMQIAGSSCRLAIADGAVSVEGIQLGTVVQLSIVLGDVAEVVYVGTLAGVETSTQGPMYWNLKGLETSVHGRYQAESDSRALFAETGEKGVVGLPYTAGDVTMNHSLLTLRAGGSGWRCMYIEPTGGDPYYIVGTADTGTVLSGLLAGGALDTQLADAQVGDLCRSAAFDAGHPLDFLDWALDPDDTSWPDNWKIDLSESVYDAEYTEQERNRHGLGLTAPLAVQSVTANPVESWIGWVSPILAPCGAVLIQRHGRLAGRMIYQPSNLTGETITDDSVIYASVQHWPSYQSAERLTVYDRSNQPGVPLVASDVVAEGVAATANSAWGALVYVHRLLGMDPPPPPLTGASATATRIRLTGQGSPVATDYQIRAPVYGGSPGPISSAAGRTTWRVDILARMGPWIQDRPEIVTVTLPGWRSDTIGDDMALDLERLQSRAPSTNSLRGAMGLVIGGGPDFFGSTSTYTVAVIPSNATT
jgi:hypothetical protein